MEMIHKKAEEVAIFRDFGERVGVKPGFLLMTTLFVGLSFILFGVGGSVIAALVGFVYPSYESFISLETKDSDKVKFWLQYWVCYALFNLFETFIDAIMFWVPMYYLIKICFLFWLFLPQFKGAEPCYTHIVAPFGRQHRAKIDRSMNDLSQMGTDALNQIKQAATKAQKQS